MVGEQQIIFFGKFPHEFRISFTKIGAYFIVSSILLTMIHGEALVFIITIYAIIFVLGGGLVLFKKAIFADDNNEIDYRGSSSIQTMKNFHMAIETILEPGSAELKTTSHRLGSIESRLGDRIKELKTRLEIHEEILNNLTQREWPMMLQAPVEYMGMAQIRRCVEKLLDPMVKKLGISVKPKDRGVHTLKNILLKNNALSVDVLADIEVIEAITNPAAHDFDTSEERYITSLTSFVGIVEWYVEKSNDYRNEE
jgi:hypothetical protein